MIAQDNIVIDAKNISYKIKDKTILSHADFRIPEASFTSIIGMNGSGKTTLLKLLCNIIHPTNGEIRLFGKNVNSYSTKELAQNISVVFQSNETNFDFSVMQIVLMGRIPYQRILDSDKQEDFTICEQAMKQTNTWHLKDRLVNSLSGGERQRVFIARSLAQQTKVMLLDEPVANLDLRHQIEIMGMLKQIQQTNNTTILIVLHDLSLALKYSDNALALKKGEMIFFDNVKNVLTEQNIPSLFEINAKLVENDNIIITNN